MKLGKIILTFLLDLLFSFNAVNFILKMKYLIHIHTLMTLFYHYYDKIKKIAPYLISEKGNIVIVLKNLNSIISLNVKD